METEIKKLKKEIESLRIDLNMVRKCLINSHVDNQKLIRDVISRQHQHGKAIADAGLFK